ncbi:hypothetical protein ACYPKM_03745 [Pseudomonas aeruginosa]
MTEIREVRILSGLRELKNMIDRAIEDRDVIFAVGDGGDGKRYASFLMSEQAGPAGQPRYMAEVKDGEEPSVAILRRLLTQRLNMDAIRVSPGIRPAVLSLLEKAARRAEALDYLSDRAKFENDLTNEFAAPREGEELVEIYTVERSKLIFGNHLAQAALRSNDPAMVKEAFGNGIYRKLASVIVESGLEVKDALDEAWKRTQNDPDGSWVGNLGVINHYAYTKSTDPSDVFVYKGQAYRLGFNLVDLGPFVELTSEKPQSKHKHSRESSGPGM